MADSQSYCLAVRQAKLGLDHVYYHDTEYGFRTVDDNVLFGRLLLEINQAVLSWDTILRKKEAIREAYANFDIERVAHFGPVEEDRLMADPGIIRNRLKVKAAVFNARAVLEIINSYGSFSGWLDQHHPLPIPNWVKLFKRHFKFTGGEITKAFLISTGYLPGAHDPDCPIFIQAAATKPKWMERRVPS